MVVVAGASAEWLSVADRVLVLDEYAPAEATEAARRVVREAGLTQPVVPPADWARCLADRPMEGWKELAQIGPARIRVQDGVVRLGGVAEARMPRRFSDDDRLRGAAVLLCNWLRHCVDRALTPTREGMLRMLATGDGYEWGSGTGYDLARPRPRDVWGIWTRLTAGRGGASES